MNKFFYNLNIDCIPYKEMYFPTELRAQHVPLDTFSNDMISLVDKMGIDISKSCIFYTPPYFNYASPHIDGAGFKNKGEWVSRCKLNYAYGNTECTKTDWFDVDIENRVMTGSGKTNIGQDYQSINLFSCKLAESTILSKWHLFESGIPHRVYNNTQHSRWCLSIPIVIDNHWLTFDESVEVFSKYL